MQTDQALKDGQRACHEQIQNAVDLTRKEGERGYSEIVRRERSLAEAEFQRRVAEGRLEAELEFSRSAGAEDSPNFRKT